MQKIDFTKSLESIVSGLHSEEIVNHFKKGFNNPGTAYQYNQITPLLFQSKSNFDQMKTDSRYIGILSSLFAELVYSEENLASLTGVLVPQGANGIITSPNAIELYNFHNTLITTLKLSKEVLINQTLDSSFETSLEKGILVFQILIEQEGLSTEKYIKIFSALQELIETISKIYKETEQTPEIILLDSGSDTNVGIKSGIETTKSLFLMFKEIWDFIANHRYYKAEQKNKALLNGLSIRTVIQEKVTAGIITPEEGKEYTHIVKTRTEDLIGMKVMPKVIVMEKNEVHNKKLLEGFEGLKLLTDGDD